MLNFKVSAWQAIQSLSNVQQVVKFSVGCFRKYALDRITKQNLSHSQWRISHCWHAAVVLFWLLIVALFYCKNSLCKKSFCKNNGVAMEVGCTCSPVSLPEHCKYVWVILIPTCSCSEYPPPPEQKNPHAFCVPDVSTMRLFSEHTGTYTQSQCPFSVHGKKSHLLGLFSMHTVGMLRRYVEVHKFHLLLHCKRNISMCE